jgi:hypothetical protein
VVKVDDSVQDFYD